MRWTEIAAVTVLVGAGGVAVYAALQASLRRAVAERQKSFDRQLAAMATTVKALQARVVDLNRLASAHSGEIAAISAAADNGSAAANEQMSPEMLAMVTAATMTFLGKTAHIRSARLLPAVRRPVSAWTQQGRAIAHTSRNLRGRD